MTHHRPSDLEPAIPDDNAPVPPAKRPTWWRVRRVRAIAFTFLGLAVALSLLSALLSWRAAQVSYEEAQTSAAQAEAVDQRLQVLEDYVAGKGEQRDAETQRQNQQFNQFVCDVLDQLPTGEALDRVRTQYGCGPGLTRPLAATSSPGATPGTSAPARRPASTPPPPAASRSTEPSPTPTPAPSVPAATTAPAPTGSTPSPRPDGLLCTVLPIIC